MSSKLMQAAITGALGVQRSFTKADDDWVPVMLVESKTGDVAAIEVGKFFFDDETKYLFAERGLPTIIELMNVRELVLVNAAWALTCEADEEPELRPSESPERVEVLVINSVSAEGIVSAIAPIGRDPLGVEPPTLGEFDKLGVAPDDSSLLGPALETFRRTDG